METELVKMSPKGQLVVPQEIRELEGFKPGERFIAVPVKGGVLFKKVEITELKREFEILAKEIETLFKKRKVIKADVAKAVEWARKR